MTTENKKRRKTKYDDYLERVTDRYYETVVDSRYDYRREEQIYKIFIACAKREVKEIPLHTLPHVWLTKGTMLVEPVHKERGIFEIMKRYNVSDDRIVVFGDGLNDCSMFRPEWMTVAMGNAKPILKRRRSILLMMPMMMVFIMRADISGGYEYHSKENKIAIL